MKKNQIRETMDRIHIPEEEKEQLWNNISQRADRQLRQRKRIVTAAILVFVLLAIPTSVYAAHFQWNWSSWGEKNEELNNNFAREHESVELQGFRFRLEQAFYDKSLGIAYYHISVTDISGKDRNPKDYSSEELNDRLKEGDITFDIHSDKMTFGRIGYDKKNSTKKTAYYYLEAQIADKDSTKNTRINISIHQLQKVVKKNKSVVKHTSEQIESQTIKIRNIISMPSLTWNMGTGKVRISSIAAKVQNVRDPKFEILLNDGTSIRDFPDFTNTGMEGAFTFGTENEQIYRFDYIDINKIRGIRLDGTFYPAEQADKE